MFPVLNLSCAGCSANAQRILSQQTGVISAEVNLATKTATVEYDTQVILPEQMQQAIRSAGYDLVIDTAEDNAAETAVEAAEHQQYRSLKRQVLVAGILSLILVAVSMTPLMHLPYAGYLMWALATPVVFVCGRRFFVGAYKQARNRSTNMDTLVALSTGTAYLFSVFNLLNPSFWAGSGLANHVYFESSAVIITFILIGKLLEERAKQRTSWAIKKLMGLYPKTATVVSPDGSFEEKPIKDISVDTIILVKSGEKIAFDGIITEGMSAIDESMITGEPVPAEKQENDLVFAGTVNQFGSFRFRVQKTGKATLLSQIIRMVSEAQGSKAPIQKLVDKIAAIFVPTVLAIAILSTVVWTISGTENAYSHGLLAFITVLIIACPCALGLATPTAIMVGIGKGAETGMLIKDAENLESLKNIDVVVLDKTGTITEGKPSVTGIKWSATATQESKNILFSIEHTSGHPLAQAICSFLDDAQPIDGILSETEAGFGVRAKHQNQTYQVGSKKLFEGLVLDEELKVWSDTQENEGQSIVWFGSEKEVLAVVALSDRIKDSSVQAIAQLQASGVEVIMATGDHEKAAEAIARQAGIKEYVARTLPEDKLRLIQKLQREGKTVAMVGDGINDSAALAQANIGFAMGKGSDIAMEAASTTIVSGDLRKINAAIHLSQNTVKVIRQNLFFAFIYNVLAIPIAAGVLYPTFGFQLNPMIAGLAMALSSVSVVSNSLRLKRVNI